MPYLIDGNNLLGLSHDLRVKDPGSRSRLVQQLAAFARSKRTKVTVVFDGDPEPGIGGHEMRLGDVQVVFAGRATDADSLILEILSAARDPASHVLITSDRALGERAKLHRARVITSRNFRRTLDDAAMPDRGPEEPLTDEQVAEWEDWFERGKAE
jgi:predicted RNA-binding protein with PIN domain